MAFIAEMSAQKGVLWWASHHRHHHTHSDDPDDVHSPRHHGFWYAHLGWIFDPDWADTEDKRVKDLSRYPELVWIDRWHMLPPTVLGVASYLIGGWSGFIVGFVWSTVLVWHSTFTINSLAHVVGTQRYDTDDDSRNNWALALLTFGEGWHNNHHHYQASAAQGFHWWEFDLSYYVLKALETVGIVEDLRTPPEHVVEDEPHPAVQERNEETSADEAEDEGLDAGYLGDQVEEIRLSAARAQEEAVEQVRAIRLAATRRYEALSDQASRRCAEVGQRVDDLRESARRAQDDLRESAKRAQQEAGKQVDRVIVETLSKPSPAK
ncbi:MAG: fatty acid desaturase [Bradymonadaceae bacterium]